MVQIAATMVGAAAMPAMATRTHSAWRKSRMPKSQERKTPIRARVPITIPSGPVMASTIPCRRVWMGDRSMLCARAGEAMANRSVARARVAFGFGFARSLLQAG